MIEDKGINRGETKAINHTVPLCAIHVFAI